ncbi:MAG TPA: NAD(P)-dependent alcohol dehydrogenase [Ilumatobacteraceae bacterium]|nr:NAD(P)-dependent alcohol dehydrogenase [Ilumatobacteraceae bacterium]
MKAVVHQRYGGPEVLHLEEVERPEPKPDEVLIRVVATTVNRTDCGFRSADPFLARYFTGWRRPKCRILGSELAGVVKEVGSAVTEFSPGDRVFGVNSGRYGAHAEYMCMRAAGPLATMPEGMTFDEAASVCDGAIIALTALRRSGLKSGQRLLVYGASGAIGTAAIQLGKHFDAHVTAVCNTANVDLAKSLGADEVIDYLNEDFTKNGQTYDVIFDAVGKHSFRRCRKSLESGGTFAETDLGFMWHVPFLALATRVIGTKTVTLPVPKYTKADVLLLKELIEAGEYRAVIDRRYPLDELVVATRYVETGQKVGNVVITVGQAS